MYVCIYIHTYIHTQVLSLVLHQRLHIHAPLRVRTHADKTPLGGAGPGPGEWCMKWPNRWLNESRHTLGNLRTIDTITNSGHGFIDRAKWQ